MRKAIRVFALISSLLSTIQSENPKHTSTFRTYKLELFNQGKDWYAAKKVCTDRDSWHVEIKDRETYDAVRNLTRADIWIGLNYLPKYKWLWSEEGELRFSKWDSSSPIQYKKFIKNQCVRQFASTGLWRNHDCTPGYKYVCQSDMTFINKTCTNETCSNHGNCIMATWKDRYNCNCEPGYFGTKCESDFITISIAKGKRSLKRGESIDVQLKITSYDGNVNVDIINQDNVKIKSVTTSNISSSNPSTTLTINIGPIEVLSTTILYKFEAGPQGNNLYSRVVVLTLVVNDACDSSPCNNGATCQYTTAEPYYNCTCRPEYNGTACEEPTYNLNKNCKYHVNFYKKKTFGDANTTCNSLGGTVAMMKTDAIQDFVESQIIDQYGKEGTIAFWIGAYKPNTDWLWVDDTPITNNKWAWSSVSQGNGYLFMSSYLTTRNNMKWFNDDGTNTQGYVCEVPAIDRCSTSPCLNSGTCIQIGCQRKCKCMWGFTGENCETRISQISCFQSEISIKWNQEKHKFGSVYKLHLEDLMSKTSKVTNVQILLTNEPTINIGNVSEPTPIHCFASTRLSISANKYILVDLWVARIRMSLKSVAKVYYIFDESKFKLEFVDLA